MAYVSQETKKKLAPKIKEVLKKYGVKGTISVRNHMSLVVTLRSGEIDFASSTSDGTPNHYQVNHYWIDDHWTGDAANFLKELVSAMKGPDYFDKSDVQRDYFFTSHYFDIDIGKWNKDYQYTPIN